MLVESAVSLESVYAIDLYITSLTASDKTDIRPVSSTGRRVKIKCVRILCRLD